MSPSPVQNTRRTPPGTPPRRPGWLIPAIGGAVILGVLALTFLNQRTNLTEAPPISTLNTRDFHALLFSPVDANVVFFGHHDGLLVSNDQGATWQPTSLQGADAMSLAGSGTRSRRIYAAGHGVLLRSDDAGATWAPISGALAGADIHAFAVSPDTDARVYAFVVGQGLLASEDGGANWRPLPSPSSDGITALAVESGDKLFAADAGGNVFQRDDGGEWRASALADGMQATALAFDARTGALYATAAMTGMKMGMVYRLAPNATTWKAMSYPGASTPVAIAVSPQDGETLLVVSANGQVYRSRDGGTSWR